MNKRTFLIVVSDQQEGTEDALDTIESYVTAFRDALFDLAIEVHEVREVSEPLAGVARVSV